MASPNIDIKITADDKASAKLKGLDGQLDKTGGGMGKLAGAAAVGAAALVAVGVKSVMAFEDLGLSIGKMADATGLSAEEASRLTEVAGDLGISQETVTKSIGIMSKALGKNADAFKEYGVEVVKNDDGTTNMNETFLQSVDAINQIQDPLKRAEAASKVFGKGYQRLGELIGQSSDQIRTDLAAVSDQKVFDEEKVKQARDLRGAFDSIVDAGQDLMLTIGSALAPVIVKLAPQLVKVVEAAKPLAEAIGEILVAALEMIGPIIEGLLPLISTLADGLGLVADVIGKFKPTGYTKALADVGKSYDALKAQALDAGMTLEDFEAMTKQAGMEVASSGKSADIAADTFALLQQRVSALVSPTDQVSASAEHMGIAQADAAAAARDLGVAADGARWTALAHKAALDEASASIHDVDVAYQTLMGHLDEREAWRNAQEAMYEYGASADHSAEQTDAVARTLATFIQQANDIPSEVKTKMYADLDQGSVDKVYWALEELRKTRTAKIVAAVGNTYALNDAVHGATGGIVTRPTMALIGEAGPEAVIPLNKTPGSSPLPAGLGGGGDTIIINSGLDSRRVQALLRKDARRGVKNPWLR